MTQLPLIVRSSIPLGTWSTKGQPPRIAFVVRVDGPARDDETVQVARPISSTLAGLFDLINTELRNH
jgi:hypothetical protein